MNVPVLTQLIILIEEIFKSHGSEVAQAAGQAAAGAALETAQQDPKVQAATEASIALLAAAQNLKAVMETHPAAAAAAPVANPNTTSS